MQHVSTDKNKACVEILLSLTEDSVASPWRSSANATGPVVSALLGLWMPVSKDLVSLISLHIFVITQLARIGDIEPLLMYLSSSDLSPSVAEHKSLSLCCWKCLVLLPTDLISFVCLHLPFSSSLDYSKCSWILTNSTWMGSWTSSVDPQVQASFQGSRTPMTWHDPFSLPQVSGVSQPPMQGRWTSQDKSFQTLKLFYSAIHPTTFLSLWRWAFIATCRNHCSAIVTKWHHPPTPPLV